MALKNLETMTPDELFARLESIERLSRMTRKSHERDRYEAEWTAVCRELNGRATADVLATF